MKPTSNCDEDSNDPTSVVHSAAAPPENLTTSPPPDQLDSREEELPPLDGYRPYLMTLARASLPRFLHTRLDASDIVQETLLEAHQKRHLFVGRQSAALAAWLRELLAGNLIDLIRRETRNKRDARREVNVADFLEASAVGLALLGAKEQSSPSLNLQREQEALQVARALESLPDAQREAMLLRYCQNLTISQIAESMQKSTVAVAGLLKRGTATLREHLLAESRG